MKATTMQRCMFLLTVWSILTPTWSLQKAKVPKMDPKPEYPKITHRVYFDVEIEGGSEEESGGLIVFGLFGEIAPKTVENFRAICTGEKGIGSVYGKPLHYKGSTFHRIIPNFMIQGGDFTHNSGEGGESIYGLEFEDESLSLNFNKKLFLAMANKGPNTNGSQFFINTVKTRWLDGSHVIFGMVLEGSAVVTQIEMQGSKEGVPRRRVVVKDSGEFPPDMETS